MVPILKRALSRIIIPQYPGLEDVVVTKSPTSNYLRILYLTDPKVTVSNYRKIVGETESIWRMLAPPMDSDIIVDFKKLSDKV